MGYVTCAYCKRERYMNSADLPEGWHAVDLPLYSEAGEVVSLCPACYWGRHKRGTPLDAEAVNELLEDKIVQFAERLRKMVGEV